MSAVDDLFELGNSLLRQGKWGDAIAQYLGALRIEPDDVEVHCNLGMALLSLARYDEAVGHLRMALKLRPNLAQAHNNLGIAFRRQGKWQQAVQCFMQAVGQKPDFAEAHYNLGNAYKDRGHWDRAVAHYLQALHVDPSLANAHNNLGSVLQGQCKLDEAAAHYSQAIQLNPGHAEAHRNLGTVLQSQGKLDEAWHYYEQSLRIRPEFAEARHDRALLWLLRGDFEQGWREYDWRLQLPGADRRTLNQPLWDGAPLAGRTILLHAEQGLGDTIQFIRYASLVKQRGGRVIVECQPPLLRLLAQIREIDCLYARGSPSPPSDVRAPLLNLPAIFRTTLDSVPNAVPYLHADANLVDSWRRSTGEIRRVGGGVRSVERKDLDLTSHCAHRTPHFLVGIAWQGNPAFRGDRQRSIPPAVFAPLAEVPGVVIISLQKGEKCELRSSECEVEKNPHSALRTLHSALLTPVLDEASGPFMDTAAIMKCLDLVITSDTAVAHLAGALAVPVWVALAETPDWRWLLEREDSPWYPTMRLFRQTRSGQWKDVFERMAEEVKRRMVGRISNPALSNWPD